MGRKKRQSQQALHRARSTEALPDFSPWAFISGPGSWGGLFSLGSAFSTRAKPANTGLVHSAIFVLARGLLFPVWCQETERSSRASKSLIPGGQQPSTSPGRQGYPLAPPAVGLPFGASLETNACFPGALSLSFSTELESEKSWTGLWRLRFLWVSWVMLGGPHGIAKGQC